MVAPRSESVSLVSAIGPRPVEASEGSSAQSLAGLAVQDRRDELATFNFDGKVEQTAYPSLSPVQQDKFKDDFWREVATLKAWSVQQHWVPPPPPDFRIYVSDEFKISRSLLPAAIGQKGRMEFPAWKVVAGEAAIAHELVHVYFPNGNRLLAEGLAVHLQAEIGGNPAFPNFGRALHEMVRELLCKMAPGISSENPESLKKIRIADLDKIATPSPLRLRVGLNLYQADAFGQAHIYPIAGSFVQFLIEAYGMDKLRALFLRTPLQPFERNAGSLDRWTEIYGTTLDEIEQEWKSKVVE
jgi:hypothetical protein